MGKGFGDAFKWIVDHWKEIVADLTAIGTAYIAFKVISTINKAMEAFKALMIAQETVTIGATIAQYALNLAMSLNPIVMIAIGIGALIGIIVLLWLNWDKVSKWFKESWAKVKAWWNDLWTGVKAKTDEIVGTVLGWLKEEKAKWTEFKLWFMAIVSNIVSSVVSKWQELKTKVISFVQDLYNNAKSKFESLKSTLTTIWEGIKNAIMHPIDTAKKAVGSAIDWIKSKFSGLHISLPNIKVPSFSIQNWSNNPADWLKRMPSVKVSWHAEGGLVNRATLIGAGEAGNEAILPLQGKHMLPMAKAISEFLQQKDINRQTPTEVPIMINGRELARAIIVDIDQEMQRRAVIRNRGV